MELPIWLETLGIRSRAYLRTVLRLLGVGILFLGVFNMFGAAMLDMQAIAPYRQWGLVGVRGAGTYWIGDSLVMCFGAAIAWFS